MIDMSWALVWRFIGHWKTKSPQKIKAMEGELMNTVAIDLVIIALFVLLIFLAPMLEPLYYVLTFIAFYCVYIVISFKYEIIDIKIF